jgi:ABC-type phosphate transport system substrate-binding protein
LPSRTLLASLVLAAVTLAPGTVHSVEIVVHPSNQVTSVTRAELSKIFLKRLRTWSNGERAQPIDQLPGPVREEFSTWVHGRSVMTIEIYWKRMIFSGHAAPPRELEDDEAVLEFVRQNPGAVGYVSSSAVLEGVRRLELEE